MVTGDRGAAGPALLFDGGAEGFRPGRYRLDVAWQTVQGRDRDGSYRLELGAARADDAGSAFLRTLRSAAPLAGRWSFVGGDGGPVVGATPPPLHPRSLGAQCTGGVMVSDRATVLAVGYPPASSVDLTVRMLFQDGRIVPVPLIRTVDVIDGLSVFAPRPFDAWPWGYYAATVERDGRVWESVFCVGRTTVDGYRVPAGVDGLHAYRSAVTHVFEDP